MIMILRQLRLAVLSQIYGASAYPHHSHRAVLPPKILTVIPDCARPCISEFIIHSYPSGIVCDIQRDLGCLCSTKTTTGLTLDEGAVVCIQEFCPSPKPQIQNALPICGNQEALPNTDSTIATPLPSASAAVPSRPQISTTTTTPASSSITAQQQSPSQMAPASPVATTGFPSGLTGGQIAGITVGIVTAAVFGLSIVLLVRFARRQRKLKRQKPFQISRPIAIGAGDRQDTGSINNGIAGLERPVALQGMTRKSFSDWTTDYVRTEDIGIAISPETPRSPATDGRSVSTMSGLLPDNLTIWPQSALRPVSLRLERRPSSMDTEFEDVD